MSTLKLDTIASRDGTESTDVTNVINGSAKAWVNFDGGAATINIRASFNVSSVTDNGTANYTINFTNALEDSNYACASMNGHNTGAGAARAVEYDQDNTKTTTALQVRSVFDWTNYYDLSEVYVVVFR